MSRVLPRCRVGPCLRPNDATALLLVRYRRFNAHTGDSVADRRIDIPPRGSATCRFSTHRPSTFTCSAGEPELRSCHLYTGCRWVDLQISLPAYPASGLHPAVLTASWIFDASSVGSLSFTFSAHTFRPLGPIFPAVAHHHGLLGHSSTAWFEASFCTPTSRGQPSSLMKHRFHSTVNGRVCSTREWSIPLTLPPTQTALKFQTSTPNGPLSVPTPARAREGMAREMRLIFCGAWRY